MWESFYLSEMEKEKINQIFVWSLIIPILIGLILYIHRYVIPFIPYDGNWRILLNHLISGFIAPIILYLFLLGGYSFFNPKREIKYNLNYFLIPLFIYATVMIIGWEFFIQRIKNIDQTISELIGIFLSYIYFR